MEWSMSSLPATLDLASPGLNLDAYVKAVNGIAVLSVEEEQALANRLYQEGDVEAARQLVLANLRFVIYIARSYAGYGLSEADLIQEGNIGLMKAVKRFNPEYKVRLVSFAVHWIKAEIHEFILRNWRIVRVATTKAQKKLFFNLRSKKQQLGWLGQKEAALIAADLGVKPETVVQMEGRLAASDTAFDASADDDDEMLVPSPAQYLAAEGTDPAEIIAMMDASSDEISRLTQAMHDLDERAQMILRRRWLDESKATLHELAAEYGISAERVRQLEQAAMKKIKAAMDQPL
jgi:RNA polymerase sigma-32 factor